MNKIKIKQHELFDKINNTIIVYKVNPFLDAFLSLKAESGELKYRIECLLRKAVNKALDDFKELQKSITEELAIKKKVKLKSGNEFETFHQVVNPEEIISKNKDFKYEADDLIVEINGAKVKGKKVLINKNEFGDNEKKFNERLLELLNVEIELDCAPIKVSLLSKEKLPADVDLGILENFLVNDMQ